VSRTCRFFLLALALAGVLGLASCSEETGAPVAIEVNGETVSINEFSQELATYEDEANQLVIDGIASQAGQQGQPIEPLIPADPENPDEAVAQSSLPSGIAASVATSRVVYMLVGQELAERDIEVTDEDVEAQRAQLSAPATDPSTGQPTGEENPFSTFSEEFQAQYAEDQAAVAALREAVAAEGAAEVAEPTDEEVAAFIEQTGDQICISGAVVADEATAADAVARARAGEDLEAIAVELDPTSQGADLGCFASTGAPEVDTALASVAEGDLADPIALAAETGGGFLVARVDSRGALSEEDARAQLTAQAEQAAAQEDPLQAFFGEAIADADIRVASRYGRWDDELLAVVPPEGPESGTEATTTTLPLIDPATGQPVPAEEAPVEGG
jgi:hypothetical protein